MAPYPIEQEGPPSGEKESRTMTTLAELNLMRRAHAGAARRAAAAWKLVNDMRSLRVLLPYSDTLSFLASAIYYNAGYDACENYDCIEDFEAALAEDLATDMPERVEVEGVEHVVLRPFFSDDYGYLLHLKMTYLHGCKISELKALDVPAPSLVATAPAGITDDEVEVLYAHHRASAIKLVNKLRHLRTALAYLETGLRDLAEDKYRNLPKHTMDPRAAGLVTELLPVVEMDFSPAPCGHFGTEADRVNPLRALPTDEDGLASLLSWT
jgi:hypothetical protein